MSFRLLYQFPSVYILASFHTIYKYFLIGHCVKVMSDSDIVLFFIDQNKCCFINVIMIYLMMFFPAN